MIGYLLAFAGLLAGVLLSYIAPEELKDGVPFFLIAQKITIALLIFMAADMYFSFIVSAIVSLIVFIPLLQLNRGYSVVSYALFPILVGRGYEYTFIVFVFGIPTGALIVIDHVKRYEKLRAKDLRRIAIGIIPYLIFFITALAVELIA